MQTPLSNKTTLVTGVSSGIGREIAQLLAERGARVFGTARNPRSASSIRGVELVLNATAVPESATVALAMNGLLAVGALRIARRRRRPHVAGGSKPYRIGV